MKICYTEMTGLLQFIVNVRKTDSNLIALCNSRTEVAGCASELLLTFLHVGSSTKYSSSEQLTFLLSTSPVIQPYKQKSNEVRSGDSNSSISVTIQN